MTSVVQIPLSPTELIERFCCDAMAASDFRFGTRTGEGQTTSRGFCGFTGSDGFDDGYDFMEEMLSRGWRDLPGKGDWPLVVYVHWRPRNPDDSHAIAEYSEGELTVWVFETPEAAKRHYDTLADIP